MWWCNLCLGLPVGISDWQRPSQPVQTKLWVTMSRNKLRVPVQNGISQACYIVKIHHSGPEPDQWMTASFITCTQCSLSLSLSLSFFTRSLVLELARLCTGLFALSLSLSQTHTHTHMRAHTHTHTHTHNHSAVSHRPCPPPQDYYSAPMPGGLGIKLVGDLDRYTRSPVYWVSGFRSSTPHNRRKQRGLLWAACSRRRALFPDSLSLPLFACLSLSVCLSLCPFAPPPSLSLSVSLCVCL